MDQTGLSLEKQIGRRLLWVLLVCLIGMLGALHLVTTHITGQYVLTRLQHDAESVITGLSQDAAGRWQFDEDALPQIYQRVQSGHYYHLASADDETEFRSRSLWDFELNLTGTPAEESAFRQSGPGGQTLQAWQQHFSRDGANFTLWIAEDITPMLTHQLRLEAMLSLGGLLTLAVLLWFQRNVLRRGFARLEPLQRAIASQQAGESVDLPQAVPLEVQPLVNSIRGLIHQSHARIARSRTSLGNLVHELRRPLSELQWQAEQETDSAKATRLQRVHDALNNLIDRELRRARIAGSPAPGQRFVPSADLPHLVTLLSQGNDKPVTFDADIPERSLPYDRDDMLELLGNLLENAWRFARGQVRLSVREAAHQWWFQVEDDGEGVAASDLQKLAERGVRLDETRDGHGIGLSLCKDIAASYGGELRFERAALGGLCVTVCLPGEFATPDVPYSEQV